jgi:hypothetical protein
VLFEQQLTEFSGPGGRFRVTLMSRHDGAFHEDMPLPRECIDVADAGLGGQLSDIASDIRQVPDGRLVDRVLSVIDLDHGREE